MRRAFHPAQFPRLMPHIVIAEIQPEPFDVTYRLVGTMVSEVSRFDFTGMSLSELRFAAEDKDIWMDCHRMAYNTGLPVYGRVEIPHEHDGQRMITEEFGIFPVSHTGDDVHQTIAVEDYMPPDVIDLVERRPTRPRS